MRDGEEPFEPSCFNGDAEKKNMEGEQILYPSLPELDLNFMPTSLN